MGKPTSAAGVRAPWLRLAAENGEQLATGVPSAPPASLSSGDAKVFSSPPKRYIDPLGGNPSFAIRLVTWQLPDGLWAFGVLKEGWAHGNLLNGEPEQFKLWQCNNAFSNLADAQRLVHFYNVNKNIEMIERELLGERTYDERTAEGFTAPTVPPIVAGKYWQYDTASKKDVWKEAGPLPFKRKDLTSGKAYTETMRLSAG